MDMTQDRLVVLFDEIQYLKDWEQHLKTLADAYAVETTISAQFGIGEERTSWRYANWKVGKIQGEVDFVRIHPGTQRPDVALEVKWSDGPFDHPAELKEAVNFCERNGLTRLYVTTRTQKGVKWAGSVELVYVPSALFALALNGGLVFK